MPGNYSKIKTVVTGEVITAADRNAEHDNHITNQTPAGTDDYSANITQMQAVTDPYPGGVESLATSLAGELERLRFLIKQISGADQWYIAPDNSLLSTSSPTYLGVNATNPDNANPNSHALFKAEVGGMFGGDPYAKFSIPLIIDWSIGVDNSDNAKFKISRDPTLGTHDFLIIDTTGQVGIGGSPGSHLDVGLNLPGEPVITRVRNTDNTNAASAAMFKAEVGGTTAGDPYTFYVIPGGVNWSIGADNSDSDKFKISMGNALGTNDFLAVDTSGNLNLVSGRYSGRLENPAIQAFVKDDFFGTLISATRFMSEMGWVYSAGSLVLGGDANHPGTFTMGTTSSAGNIAYFYQDCTTHTTHDFDATMIIFPSTGSNISLLVGFVGNVGSMSPSYGIYFRKDSAETTWKGVCVSADTSTTVDTTVTVSASWFKLRIRKSSGTVYFSVNGGSEYGISTNVPSTTLVPEFLVRTDTTLTRQLTVDYFDLHVSGISR
ncbi:MAG: hypothetical protein ABIL14_01385 [candidate division WOR-3 bacterium]